MAPPDLETLARMRGTTTRDVRAYAERKAIPTVRKDYGKSRAGNQRRDVHESNTASERSFSFATSERRGGSARKGSPEGPRSRMEGIDPVYKPLVENYFRKIRKSN
jgi:hypothetical protein